MPGVSTAPPRRDQALAYIVERIVRSGTSPTIDEIGRKLDVSKSRARKLVDELITRKVIDRTAGSQRNLQIIDIALCRAIIVERLHIMGLTVAEPMGDLKQPYTQEHLPILSPFEHLPDG